MEKYDLIILGSGSAAFGAAIKASDLGANIAMIERGVIGGTCVNVGCIPTKHLLHVGEIHYYENHGLRGLEVRSTLDFGRVMHEKDNLVKNLRKEKYIDVANSLPGVSLIRGRAFFTSKNEVSVNGKTLYGEKFIVATGSSPNIMKIKGIEEIDYLTNVEALDLKELPESMIIIGGRALACEFAQMYAHFGTEVTMLQRSPLILPDEEPEISIALRKYLEEEGIEIHTGVTIKSVRREGDCKVVKAEVRGEKREFKGEKILMATGRKPNTEGLGLDKVGVEVDKNGAIVVNDEMQTTAKHVYAAGDVIGKPMLETTAAKEGSIAAENALKNKGIKMDYFAIPHAVFTSPQVASVGLTDKEALEKGYNCVCKTLPMKLVPKANVIKDTRGLIKMVIERDTKRILGIHILAPFAAEMIHEGVLAVKYKLTIDDIIDTVHVFPTMAEAIKLVATSFKRDVTKMSCCAE